MYINTTQLLNHLHPSRSSSGNTLQFWNSQLPVMPGLAAVGLAYISSPASTAPAEHEFSEGRTQVNWNQQSMSSQTFRAKMSVSAWARAPWYNLKKAAEIIAASSRPLRAP
ncbi:hypothetical protein C2E23DRAFT_806661 [Lenzites betulinus]|nr:hypothetical protein C2E23DRAFT_806661 [Lenzites betulinus]